MSDSETASPASFPIVTVDGGAATGKSSTARGVAEKLHFLHVDTGSHYRAVTLLLIERSVEPVEDETLETALQDLNLSARVEGTEAVLVAGGRPVPAEELRSEEVNRSVSSFAALPAVRRRLLRYQRWFRDLAMQEGFGGLIMEGRDIGSVVFPDASHRFFLEADPETRVRRRSEEGQTDSVMERDKADSGRKVAPLLCPEGARRINTGDFTLAQVIEQICKAVDPSLKGTSI